MMKPPEMSVKSVRLHIKGLECLARVGVHKREKGGPQKIRVDLELEVKIPKDAADRIENVVCYDWVADGVRGLALESHSNLVETLAARIVDYCFEDSRVYGVRVLVEKPGQFLDAASVGSEIRTSREDWAREK